MTSDAVQRFLIIGGGGFLGKNITEMLLERGEKSVSIFDLRVGDCDPRVGDITDLGQVRKACENIDVLIHTASPIHGKPAAVYFKVNVDGTANVIEACVLEGVKKLIFTSSAGVIYNGQDLFNADETSDYCKVHMDAYNETKALAEVLVLEANGREGLLTCSIRPSGIFGPRDSQGSLSIVESAMKGQWRVMIGKNNNLFDLTYVDNVSHAHLLAADKMELGSGIEGQAFLITNDQPIFFWDYPKLLLHHLGYRNTHSFSIPTPVAFFLGDLMDAFTSLLSPFKSIHPSITRFRVTVISGNRYFDISKAKNLLGYKPIVDLMEGFKRTAAYWKSEGYGNK